MENQEKKEKLEEKVEKEEVKTENGKKENKEENKEVKKEEKKQAKEKADVEKTTEEPKFKKVSTETIKAETKKEVSKKDNKTEKNNKEGKEKKQKGKSKVGFWIGGILLLIIALAIVMAFVLKPSSPEKTIDGLFNCLKTGDIQSVSKYVTNLEEVKDMNDEDIPEEERQLLFNKLEWKIVNVTKEKDVAKVEVEITNKDFKAIITNFMKKVVKVAMSGEAISEDKQEQYLIEELKNDSIQAVNEKIEIDLEKQDGNWKAKVNEDTIMSLLPGFEEGMNSIESMIEE